MGLMLPLGWEIDTGSLWEARNHENNSLVYEEKREKLLGQNSSWSYACAQRRTTQTDFGRKRPDKINHITADAKSLSEKKAYRMRKKILASHTFSRGLVFRRHKELKKLNTKGQIIQSEMENELEGLKD
jgi:hypothetical protein